MNEDKSFVLVNVPGLSLMTMEQYQQFLEECEERD